MAIKLFQKLNSPIIVKPAVSGGSLGVGVKNVVETETELLAKKSFMHRD